MPTYTAPLNGISQSAALQEAAVAAPVSRIILETLELWHPSMAVPVRVVVDTVPLLATLETTAPRNPDQVVTFAPCSLSVNRPEESDKAATPEITITIGNVTGIINDALERARSSAPDIRATPWQLIERIYASDDTGGPAELPVFKVTPTSVSTQGAVALITAAYRPSVNISVPAATFTPENYPGLLQ